MKSNFDENSEVRIVLIFVQFSNKTQKCFYFVIFMFCHTNFMELHENEPLL